MKNKDIAGKRIRTLVGTVGYGLRVAWMASPIYTAARITGTVIDVVFGIALAIIGKDVLDFITMNIPTNERMILIVGKLILIVICKVLMDVSVRLMQWIRVKHEKLMGTTGDSFIFSQVSFNCITFMGALVGFTIAFFILSSSNLLFSVLTICVAIPAAISSVLNMKELYRLEIQKSEHYVEKMRENSLRVGVMRKLPKLVLFFIALCVVIGIIEGTSTVGDLSFFLGLAEQLKICIFMLTQASISIVDYRLKIAVVD